MNQNEKPLVGSCHKFSDGYGYGQRYLTSRNQLTLPCSVPVLRHPPPTERFLKVTSPTKLIGNNAQAERRNADQIRMQTSGEVGRFYVDPESEGVKLGKSPLRIPKQHHATNINNNVSANFTNKPDSSRNIDTYRSGSELISTRSAVLSSRYSPSTASQTGPVGSSQYLATLQNLDKSFSNINRRDLFAASQPGRSTQELVWCASNNNRGAQASKTWAERLRREQHE